MTSTGRQKLTMTLGIVLLVDVQVALVASGWSGSFRDWFNLVVVACQFAFAMTILVTAARAQKRVITLETPECAGQAPKRECSRALR
ncbi:hypothetical protein ACL9RL_18680 [Plantibacter sp. Mn2098]|uniref:hypothetical protein n=1 Tax=Plantibacter sp. Mn2098 TaxID=3395266 RepID=UPI003BEDCF1F